MNADLCSIGYISQLLKFSLLLLPCQQQVLVQTSPKNKHFKNMILKFSQILPRQASAFFHPQWFSTKILEYRIDQLEKREHNKPTDSTCDTQLHLLRTEMKTGFYGL